MSALTAIKYHSTKADGADNAGGKVYTYAAGTTTPQATYTTAARTTPNANPVVLDSTGRASIYLDPALAYKFVATDADGVAVPDGTVDNWRPDSLAELSNTASGLGADLIGIYGITGYSTVGSWLRAGWVTPPTQPANSAWDMKVTGDDGIYRDNVLTLKNTSKYAVTGVPDGRTHNVGNAALRFVGGDGWELGAFGYSALGTGQDALHPTWGSSYYPNAMYWSASDLSGGVTDYGIPDVYINIECVPGGRLNGADHPFRSGYNGWPTTWQCFKHQSNNGTTTIASRSTNGGAGAINLTCSVAYFGNAGYATQTQWATSQPTEFFRLREGIANGFLCLATNMETSSGTWAQDDSTRAAWMLGMGQGAGEDRFTVRRKPSGGGVSAPVELLSVHQDKVAASVPIKTPVYTFATIPAGAEEGWRAFVTDSITATFGAVVAGGGTNRVPVYYSAGAWRVG